MSSHLLTRKQIAGLREKLKRANESIQNLNTEIVAFQKERPKGGFSKDKQKASAQLVEFNRNREVPVRFGVIAGEIIHHLRSTLEHIAWALSSDSYRNSSPRAIGFPIFTEKPSKNKISTYSGQVKGILSAGALSLIEELQPYNAANPADDPLSIINELDREDKHHTLLLVGASWHMGLTIPLRLFTWTVIRDDIDPKIFEPRATDNLKLEFSFYVVFAQFGQRKDQPVIPALTELADKIGAIVERFAALKS